MALTHHDFRLTDDTLQRINDCIAASAQASRMPAKMPLERLQSRSPGHLHLAAPLLYPLTGQSMRMRSRADVDSVHPFC